MFLLADVKLRDKQDGLNRVYTLRIIFVLTTIPLVSAKSVITTSCTAHNVPESVLQSTSRFVSPKEYTWFPPPPPPNRSETNLKRFSLAKSVRHYILYTRRRPKHIKHISFAVCRYTSYITCVYFVNIQIL